MCLFCRRFHASTAAYELWLVGKVEQWREVPATLVAVERKRPAFGKGPLTWRYTFTELERGKPDETRDIEPGDIPFTALGWSTKDATARDYQAMLGQTIRVRGSPDGDRYFLKFGDRNTMSVLLSLSGTYWIWMLSVWRRRRLPARHRQGQGYAAYNPDGRVNRP